MIQMYVDLDTMEVCTHTFLQRKHLIYKSVDFTASELASMNADLLDETATGDVATGNTVLNGSVYEREYRSFTTAELAQQEESWVSQELSTSDIEVRKHDDSHSRTVGTKPQWRTYRNALRDHVIGGVVQGTRPTRPV